MLNNLQYLVYRFNASERKLQRFRAKFWQFKKYSSFFFANSEEYEMECLKAFLSYEFKLEFPLPCDDILETLLYYMCEKKID